MQLSLSIFEESMISFIPVTFANEKTRRLADLNGVLIDLRATSGICRLLLRCLSADPQKHNHLEIEALQSAAIVRYCRTAGGVREAFSLSREMIETLPRNLRDTHTFFSALRDKHVTHSVNDWELNTPVVYLKCDLDAALYEVDSVSVNTHRVVSLAEGHIEQLIELASTLANMVEDEMVKEKAQALAIAKAMPIEKLKEAMKDRPIFPGLGNVNQRRERGQ